MHEHPAHGHHRTVQAQGQGLGGSHPPGIRGQPLPEGFHVEAIPEGIRQGTRRRVLPPRRPHQGDQPPRALQQVCQGQERVVLGAPLPSPGQELTQVSPPGAVHGVQHHARRPLQGQPRSVKHLESMLLPGLPGPHQAVDPVPIADSQGRQSFPGRLLHQFRGHGSALVEGERTLAVKLGV